MLELYRLCEFSVMLNTLNELVTFRSLLCVVSLIDIHLVALCPWPLSQADLRQGRSSVMLLRANQSHLAVSNECSLQFQLRI